MYSAEKGFPGLCPLASLCDLTERNIPETLAEMDFWKNTTLGVLLQDNFKVLLHKKYVFLGVDSISPYGSACAPAASSLDISMFTPGPARASHS